MYVLKVQIQRQSEQSSFQHMNEPCPLLMQSNNFIIRTNSHLPGAAKSGRNSCGHSPGRRSSGGPVTDMSSIVGTAVAQTADLSSTATTSASCHWDRRGHQ